MKITAHMANGDVLTWENLADIIILTPEWARLGVRDKDWDMSVPLKERKLGNMVLLNIKGMVYWVQEQDELDDEGDGYRARPSWLEPPEGTA